MSLIGETVKYTVTEIEGGVLITETLEAEIKDKIKHNGNTAYIGIKDDLKIVIIHPDNIVKLAP